MLEIRFDLEIFLSEHLRKQSVVGLLSVLVWDWIRKAKRLFPVKR